MEIRQSVWRVAILFELRDRAKDHMRSRTCLSLERVAREDVVRCGEIIGNDHEQIPVTRGSSLVTSSAS